MSTEAQISVLDELQALLERQIQAAMKSDFKTVEKLTSQTQNCVQELLNGDFQRNPDFEKQHKYILGLYKKLDLIIAGEKSHLMNQQKLADNVLKSLSAYRKNG